MGDRKAVDFNDEIKTQTAEPELDKPQQYKVVLLNDDYTSMDFVVEVLKIFFNKDEQSAAKIMLEVHQKGKGICGYYPKDVAETKVNQVCDYAKSHEYPLMCTMEKI